MIGDRVYKGFTTYQAGSGQDMRSLFADPRLVGGDGTGAFKLLPDSPIINGGSNVKDSGGRDYFGNPVPYGAAPDIGAVEWQGK
jgi:hypothetical protein